MKVSVIIPTYNRPEGLRNAVDSVLGQSVLPNEIIVVNDGADSLVLEELGEYELVKIRKNDKPMGGNFSRNRGADEADGDILMFLDDDDTWNKDKIKNQLVLFRQSKKTGLVYSNRNVVDEEGNVIRKIISTAEGDLYPDILFSNIIGTTSSVAIRKEVFVEAGKFDLALKAKQDYDLWIRICKITNVGLDATCAVNYTVSKNFKGQVSGSGEKKKEAAMYILNKYSKEIEALGRSSKRKIESNLHFYIAKSYKSTSYTKAVYYSFLSFLKWPNLKSLALLFPESITNLLARYW